MIDITPFHDSLYYSLLVRASREPSNEGRLGEYMGEFGESGAVSNTVKIIAPLSRWLKLFLAAAMVMAMSSLATASTPIFAIEKNFCAGNPALITQPENCTTASQAVTGDDVYYVLTLTNP